jgi:hypothetical protein
MVISAGGLVVLSAAGVISVKEKAKISLLFITKKKKKKKKKKTIHIWYDGLLTSAHVHNFLGCLSVF